MSDASAALYRRWVLANGWAEAAGLGTTLVLGRAVAPLLERSTELAVVLLGAVLAIVLGVLLEGALVGAAQAAVLRRALPGLAARRWVSATMLGAGIAWTLGMVPSTIAALVSSGSAQGPPSEPPAVLQYGLAVGLGLVTGPILGGAQWRVLRLHVAHAHRWLWANAAAWALGMLLVFLGMDLVPWARGGLVLVGSVYAVCGVAGLGVGVVHGAALVRLLQNPTPMSRAA